MSASRPHGLSGHRPNDPDSYHTSASDTQPYEFMELDDDEDVVEWVSNSALLDRGSRRRLFPDMSDSDADADGLASGPVSRPAQPVSGSVHRSNPLHTLHLPRGPTPHPLGDELVEVEIREQAPNQTARPPPGEVIDLTDEPDSPGGALPFPPRRNFRRSRSHAGRSPPAHSMGASAFLNRATPVIDLTDDSPPAVRPLPPPQPPRRAALPHLAEPDLVLMGVFSADGRADRGGLEPRNHIMDALGRMIRTATNGLNGRVTAAVIQNVARVGGGGLGPMTLDANPVGDVQLGYQNPAFQHRVNSAPPTPETWPEPRTGFTRDTGEELAFVCPACNQELAYDPDESPEVPAPSKKTTRGKKSQGEHHFWALKACGHVYCQSCFENRKPSAKNPSTGFRTARDEADPRQRQKLICAVEDCQTEVSNKISWVGIFL